ncbi:hypothetical protein [Bacteroides pyogenes]|uniref:hypothetical protein n=1 Tax=Bacteroides pyogenes TaxID=310300 RepID=UPI002FD89557
MNYEEIISKLTELSRQAPSEERKVESRVSEKSSTMEDAIKRERIKDIRQDRVFRKSFSDKIYNFASLYMLGVFFILVLSGITYNNFHLSDTVLITLLGTTTANVLGLLVIVITYYFKKIKS